MAISYKLNYTEVIDEIRKLGYGIDNRPGCKIALTVRSKRKLRKNPDSSVWEGVGGYPVREWKRLTSKCDDPALAARVIVAYCTGAEAPSFEQPASGPGLSPAELAAMVSNEVAKRLADMGIDDEGLELLRASKTAKQSRRGKKAGDE